MPHTMPHGDMSAAQLIVLFNDSDRHPNALSYELTRCKIAALTALVLEQVPAPTALVEGAVHELDRRQSAVSRLLGDNPALRSALGV